MSAEQWKQSVPEEIQAIESKDPSENSAVLLAALYILQRQYYPNKWGQDMQAAHEPPPDNSFEYWSYMARDELASAENYIRLGMADFAADELRHGERMISYASSKAISRDQQNAVRAMRARHTAIGQSINLAG
jgi:hypothetical protein